MTPKAFVFKPIGNEYITSLSSSTALTVPAGARVALIQAETQDVRFRDDGTAPTSTVGFLLVDGDSIFYDSVLQSLRFIETVASAKLNVLYYA